MTKQQEQKYQDTDVLREIIKRLKGSRYRLDCGHHISFGHIFGNNITIINGKEPKIIGTVNISGILRERGYF